MQTFTNSLSLTMLKKNNLQQLNSAIGTEPGAQTHFHHLLQNPADTAPQTTDQNTTKSPSSVAYSFVSLQQLLQTTQPNQAAKQTKRKHKER